MNNWISFFTVKLIMIDFLSQSHQKLYSWYLRQAYTKYYKGYEVGISLLVKLYRTYPTMFRQNCWTILETFWNFLKVFFSIIGTTFYFVTLTYTPSYLAIYLCTRILKPFKNFPTMCSNTLVGHFWKLIRIYWSL